LDFRFIHVYSDASIDSGTVSKEIARIFPSCKVDVRPAFGYDDRIELARITDVKQPFERQPKQTNDMKPLYDGFVLQRIFAKMIPAAEADHVHIIFTGLLACTFSEEDWRYHARAVVCGAPSIISSAGIVEAPAKPKEFYLAQLGGMADAGLKKQFAGRFIDYGDGRMTAVATLYALQVLFFFVTDGEPFCNDNDCRLYNAHWQEELIHMIEKGALCARHKRMASKFNNKGSGRKSF
jgi:putative metallopeptidase DUF6775